MTKLYKEVYYSLISAITIVFLILITAHFASAQKYLPPAGKTLLVIGQDLKSISDYQNVPALPVMGGVTSYSNLYDVASPSAYYPYGGLGEKLDGTVAPDVDWGAGPLNTHNAAAGFPNSVLAYGLYMTEDYYPGGLASIANGTYDVQITRLANFLKSIDKPVFLRIGYEFDGNWNTGYSNTTNYKNAYKHIVDVIRPVAPKTMMVLQACTSPVDDIIEGYHEDISQWYPGDDYVDYLGYSWFLNTPLQVSLTDEVLALARLHNKPVMVCESTPQGYDLTKGTYRYINTMLGGAPGTNPVTKTPDQIWNEWFSPFFQYIHTNSDVIRIVSYINADWDAQAQWASPYSQGYWGDSRIQANASIQQKWLTEVNTSFWLHGSSTLFNTLLNTGSTTTNNPPVVSFTSPTATTLNKGGTLAVTVSATDDDVVTGVTLSLNGTVLRKITTAPYTWGLNAATDPGLFNMAVGTYELKAVATDQNNHSTTKTFTVTVSDPTVPPVINGTSFAPADGKTLVLIGQTYRAEYDHYVSATNKAPAGSSHYAELYNGKINQGDDSNNEAFLSYINQSYPLAYAELAISIKDNPASGGYTGENAVWKACKDIPTGKWDAQIDMIAASMKSRPTIKFLVRIDYEVSLNMFANKTNTPFIDILNKYTAQGINPLEHADQIAEFDLQAYKDAYNYIAQRIRTYNKVSNAAFIFHPVRGINDAKMLYPGDANVDWFGLSIFNHDVCWPTWEGATPPFRNCPETQAMDDNVRQCMEWAKNTIKKPIIIAESASQSDVVNQNTAAFENGYLDKVFNLINTYDIKAFVYINSNWISHGWSSQWGDSRVEKDPAVLSHWLGEVLKSRYIHYPQTTTDCAGVLGGTATIDACSTCVGGTTGKTTLDTDKDGTPDCIDTDDDNDGVLDANDCAPLDPLVKGKTTWYADTDGDGFGDPAVTQLACIKPTGYVADKTDACPADANKKVAGNCGCGKTEQSCVDCAGVANGTAKIDACSTCVGGTTGKTTLDTDKDGTPDCTDTDDDNDGVLDVNDCAPLDPLVKGKTTWYADADGDGFGDPAVTQLSCTKPTGYVADKTDACPADANKKAAGNCGCGKTEQSCVDCAGVANGTAKIDACSTCVGGTTGKTTLDTDKDGTPDCTDTDDDNDGVLDANDCAPLDPLVKGKTTWYADADGDGFGDPAVTQLACTKPTGYVADKTDACPADANKKAAGNCGCGKTEQSCMDCAGVANGTAKLDICGVCTGGTTGKTTLDTDKDGTPDCTDTDDDNDGVLDTDDCAPQDATISAKTIWYADSDGDGFGDASSKLMACTKPTGYVADKTDACPTDPNKKISGNCGCNKVEGSCLDCAGVANGSAVLDNCQICVGGTTGKTACVKDCAGVSGGSAVLDNCETCVGGTTGKTACAKDCNGDFGGTATVDVCNICSGGNTGVTPKTSLAQCVTTGIDHTSVASVKIYPNPFRDGIQIDGIAEGILEIYDSAGKKIYQQGTSGSTTIFMADLASGMYLLKYSADVVSFQKVLIKE